MKLNRQIAIIDGWKHFDRCDRDNGNHWHYQGHCQTFERDLVPSNIPDYLAPENRHELERMALTIAKEKVYALGMFYDGSDWRVSLGPTVTTHPIYLSIALAEAIIEAKG